MSNQACLLCLQVIGDTGGKSPKKIGIKTLHKLITPCRRSSKSSHDLLPEFEEDETYEFCANCHPLFSKIEEIMAQISLLEEEIGSKMKQIKTTILHTSSLHLQNNGEGKIMQIRDMLLRLTDENGDNFAPDEALVKLEHIFPGENAGETNFLSGEVHVKDEFDDVDPLGDVGDQFFDGDFNSHSEPCIEKEEEEDEVESAFCIFPCPPKHTEIHKRTKKRKREDSPPLPKPITKRSKKKPDRGLIGMQFALSYHGAPTPNLPPPRSSPRRRKEAARPTGVNSAVTSSTKSNLESSDEDDNDTKSTPDSRAPNIDDVDSIATSNDAILPSHTCTICVETFISKLALIVHTSRYHGVPCIAPSCTATFRSKKAMAVHLKTAHKGFASSSRKIRPIKTSKSTSNSEDEDDTDKDCAPNIEQDDSTASTSGDILSSHKCPTCPKSFKRKWGLTRHTPSCRRIITCVAPSCTATFDSVSLRDAHLKTAHEGLTPFQCRICKVKFRWQKGIAAHMFMRHEGGEKTLSCVKCGKNFCLEENLARHLRLHDVEGSKPLVCAVCDDRFENEDRLKKHMTGFMHSKRFQCAQCPHRCKGRTELERHLKTHTNEKTQSKEKTEKCPQCDHASSDKYYLQCHIARSHPAGPVTHICHICGKGFYLSVDLKQHLDGHDGVKCDTCGETLGSRGSLQAHLIKVHGKDPYVCDECGATFTTESGFRTHKKVHAGEKRHKCETCGACFINTTRLKNHMSTHTDERPFPCPHCDNAFKTRTRLNKHIKAIHTPGYVAPTPHKCPHCEKSFHIPYFLKCHIRQVHTGERPFTCDQCGKAFAAKSTLTLHLKTTHGVVSEKTNNRQPRSKKDTFRNVKEDND